MCGKDSISMKKPSEGCLNISKRESVVPHLAFDMRLGFGPRLLMRDDSKQSRTTTLCNHDPESIKLDFFCYTKNTVTSSQGPCTLAICPPSFSQRPFSILRAVFLHFLPNPSSRYKDDHHMLKPITSAWYVPSTCKLSRPHPATSSGTPLTHPHPLTPHPWPLDPIPRLQNDDSPTISHLGTLGHL